MNVLSLDGSWTFRAVSGAPSDISKAKAIPGRVPGEVLHDLFVAKRIVDPFDRENELAVQWVGEATWQYTKEFQLTERLLGDERIFLQCDGLDTLATIYLNGKEVATTDNMHRRYAFDVKSLLKPGRNKLQIRFSPANPYTRERHVEKPIRMRVSEGHPDAYPGWIRKEGCNFGWDWGPVVVTAGIWRSIRLVGYAGGCLTDFEIRQRHAEGRVTLDASCAVEVFESANLHSRLSVILDGKTVAESESIVRGGKTKHTCEIPNPQLWWPNGMGEQPLYKVLVELLDEQGNVVDTDTKRIGLRTLRLDRHTDEWGESFQFVVNGVPFFAKGANWIPADALPGRRPDDVYRRLLEDAAHANMNMIRVWGGGIYENDVFYDLCDELGLCVWQDFMFACMGYPVWDKAFLENVDMEARDNVKRLRHHACIALWCGNNELEQQGVGKNPKIFMQWKDYKRLFDVILPRVVRQLAPDQDYWPSSPHSPLGDRADYDNPTCGDAHLWGVWHGRKPFEWYRTCTHRFNSEFGFQSFPEPRTVYGYTQKGDRNITSPVMEHHQRSGIGNTTIMQYMLDWFRLPCSFEMTLWTSQILQGMAIKYACEHWRRSMPRGMGTLYWQLNDVWPVASWASIDYHGRWKALHYMARNFFAPVLLSGLEDKKAGTVELHVTSDLQKSAAATVRWQVTDTAGKTLLAGTKAIRTPKNGNRRITTLKLQKYLKLYGARDLLVWLELEMPDRQPQRNLVLFARPKHLSLADNPGLLANVKAGDDGSFVVTMQSRRPALWAWLECAHADLRCSDNFVHICPGKPVDLSVQPSRKMTLPEFRKNLIVRSLVDTYES